MPDISHNINTTTTSRGRGDIYLPNEIPQTLESQGYSSQEFTEDCKVTFLSPSSQWRLIIFTVQQHYDVFVDRSHDDLAQWRIKIEVRSLIQ